MLRALLAIFGIAAFVQPATAELVTFRFTGLVTSANSSAFNITTGQTLSGTYTFESTATDRDSSAEAGRYQSSSSPPINLSLSFETATHFEALAAPTGTQSIFVGDGFLGDREQYNVGVSNTGGTSFNMAMVSQSDPSIFGSDALPLLPPDPADFDFTSFTISSFGVGGGVNGTLTSITAVPEPGSLSLMGICFFAIGSRRRRSPSCTSLNAPMFDRSATGT